MDQQEKGTEKVRIIYFTTCSAVYHTMNHLRSHPVGVPHHRVPLPAVGLLQARQFSLRQLIFTYIVHHEPSQAKVCHHHSVVLNEQIFQKVLLVSVIVKI